MEFLDSDLVEVFDLNLNLAGKHVDLKVIKVEHGKGFPLISSSTHGCKTRFYFIFFDHAFRRYRHGSIEHGAI